MAETADGAKVSPELAAAMAETRMIRERMIAIADRFSKAALVSGGEVSRRIRAGLEGGS